MEAKTSSSSGCGGGCERGVSAAEVSMALGGRVKRGETSTTQRRARYFIR
jgi:hypothetical protein